jgi:hypothetical protein
MDNVTHFLVLVALILFIIMSLLWFMGGSCAAGYVSTHNELPPWIQDYYNELVEGTKKATNVAEQQYRSARAELQDIAEAAREYTQSRTNFQN